MSDITIDVVEDSDHPEGGHAVIRLNGLWLLPANATYRIEPVDDLERDQLPADWPRGDRAPLATRLTPQGVEIVVGPDIVDSPSMLPGTPVAVSVPAAFVRAEVLWPDLPVSAPVSAPPVVLTAAELAAELDAVAEANRRREEAEVLLKMEMHETVNGAATALDDEQQFDKQLSQLRPRNGHAGPVADQSGLHPVLVGEPVDRTPEHSAAALVKRQTAPGTIVAREPPGQRALVPIAQKAAPPRRSMSIGAPFAVGFVVAAALTGLVALRQVGSRAPVGSEGAGLTPTLSDVLAVALVSPRGRSAAEVDLPTALKLADESLHMTAGGADQAEASFWLRKALALSVGTPQLTWSLTQLGTLYARPASGPPDYGKARLLWEMAGASGDATALCFLGSLYEHGLGVPKARVQALGYYQKAKSNGGCRDVDESIARVRN